MQYVALNIAIFILGPTITYPLDFTGQQMLTAFLKKIIFKNP